MDGRPDHPATGLANGERPRLLTTAQVADLLGVTRATVVTWARQGRFDGVQYGRRGIYRFERREIESFVARTRLAGPSPDDARSVSE